MKICPYCQNTYTDDSLQFCLQDGSPLNTLNTSENWGEAETIISPKTTAKSKGAFQEAPTANWMNNQETFAENPPKKSNTGLIIALTALITLIVAGAGFAVFLMIQRGRKVDTANINTNIKPVNVATPSNSNNNQKSNANVNANTNTSFNSNTNLNSNIASPTPSAKPTLNPKEVDAVKDDVKDALENWKDSTEDRDLDSHLESYAETVDYYNAGKVNSAKVRGDREKAFSDYDDINVSINNVKIAPDPGGDKAVVTFDKEWKFQNDSKTNKGKVQQQLIFNKINDRWLITSEKEIKVYYVDKSQE